MMRIRTDEPGPGQERAVRCIHLAMAIFDRGASTTIRWVPGHAGVQGNEVADAWTVEAAMRKKISRAGRREGGRTAEGIASLTFLKTMIKKRAVSEWRQ